MRFSIRLIVRCMILTVAVPAAARAQEVGILQPAVSASGDQFGLSVDLDEDIAVIGAPDSNREGQAVYVYTRGADGWTESAKLEPSEAVGFGWQVAVSEDTVFVLAADEEPEGAVYVFTEEGGVWREQARLTDRPRGPIEADGGVLVVGSFGERLGRPDDILVYEREGPSWRLRERLESPNPMLGDGFPNALAVDGNRIAAGSSAVGSAPVLIFERGSDTWALTASVEPADVERSHLFGRNLALSGDLLLASAQQRPGEAGQGDGAVHVFRSDGSTWAEEAVLTLPGAEFISAFGWSVDVADGVAAVGSPGFGSLDRSGGGLVVLFESMGGAWTLRGGFESTDPQTITSLGYDVALSDGWVVAGAPAAFSIGPGAALLSPLAEAQPIEGAGGGPNPDAGNADAPSADAGGDGSPSPSGDAGVDPRGSDASGTDEGSACRCGSVPRAGATSTAILLGALLGGPLRRRRRSR